MGAGDAAHWLVGNFFACRDAGHSTSRAGTKARRAGDRESAYQHTAKLTNPKNDATDIAAELKKLGFQVIEGHDLDKAAFDRKVHDFALALRGAEGGVPFYAGHGLQVRSATTWFRSNAKAEAEELLDFEMVRVDVVQRAMEMTSKINVLFLDACRDNPLARNLARSMGTRSAAVR